MSSDAKCTHPKSELRKWQTTAEGRHVTLAVRECLSCHKRLRHDSGSLFWPHSNPEALPSRWKGRDGSKSVKMSWCMKTALDQAGIGAAELAHAAAVSEYTITMLARGSAKAVEASRYRRIVAVLADHGVDVSLLPPRAAEVYVPLGLDLAAEMKRTGITPRNMATAVRTTVDVICSMMRRGAGTQVRPDTLRRIKAALDGHDESKRLAELAAGLVDRGACTYQEAARRLGCALRDAIRQVNELVVAGLLVGVSTGVFAAGSMLTKEVLR